MKLSQTKTETGTANIVDEHHSEVLLTEELNQLSFKDRNDYQGKCGSFILNNITRYVH